jgi:hypothetical protein
MSALPGLPGTPTPPSLPGLTWIVESAWAYPALEVVHLLGVTLLVGNLVAFESRVLGWARELPLPALARLSLGLAVAGFGLAALSGLTLFAAQPGEMLANPAFVWKMGLVMVAGINAAVFHARDGLRRMDAVARVQTLASLGLWMGAMICGRWIAYA